MKHSGKIKAIRLFSFLAVLITVILLSRYAVITYFPLKYQDTIRKYSQKYGLDPYLVLAVIKVESNFMPEAVSPKKARGLMQITEKTGKWGAGQIQLTHYSVEKLFDPEINIQIGCWYLSVLYQEFEDTDLVLAAYNGGSGNVSQWLKDSSLSSSGKRLDKIPFSETRNYVKKVKNSRFVYKKLYGNEF